jgi:hypothetical protein
LFMFNWRPPLAAFPSAGQSDLILLSLKYFTLLGREKRGVRGFDFFATIAGSEWGRVVIADSDRRERDPQSP